MINDRAKVQQKGAINGHLLTAWLVLIIFASSLIGQAQTLEAYDGKTIAQVRIVIEGATNGGQGEEFRGLLLLHAGAPYSVVQARASLLSLFNSGRAANARIEAEFDNQGAVIVTFVITPQARIGNIEFTGLTDELRPEDIRGRLEGLERNAKYSEANVQRGAEQIYELFRDRGYYQVGVEPEITLDATAMVAKITYHITPGAVARIGRITLEGDLNIPLQELRAKMRSQEGMPFSRVQLNDDIQRLLDRYLIAGHLNAQIGPPDVAYENATNEITIRIPISAGPVFTVRVKGYEIKEQRLREILPLLREGKVDAMSLDEGARRLRSHLQEEGFFFAEVEPPRMPDPTTERAELAFEVDTKQRYRVTEIRIEGAEDFSLADVEGELRSKTESFFPIPIFSRYTRGITSEEALQHDADLIVSRLRDQGFRRARMLSVNRAVNPDNDQLTIIFEVEKGPRSYISEIAFTGNMLLTADQLLALIELRPSAPASLSQIKYEANHILEYYFQRGYALATVSTRLIELGHERVRVIYEIKEGPLVFINRVLVNEIGLRQRTHSGRVKTFLNFEPGELLKNDELARAEQDMYALGAFRQVIVRSEPLGAEGETGTIQRNIYVDLDESKST